jgi:hypothetical protein
MSIPALPQGVTGNDLVLAVNDRLRRISQALDQPAATPPPFEIESIVFAALPAVPNGALKFCPDAKNIHDDAAAAGSIAVGGGHGSMVARINGSWRILC